MADNEICLTYIAYIIPIIEDLIGGYCFCLLVNISLLWRGLMPEIKQRKYFCIKSRKTDKEI